MENQVDLECRFQCYVPAKWPAHDLTNLCAWPLGLKLLDKKP